MKYNWYGKKGEKMETKYSIKNRESWKRSKDKRKKDKKRDEYKVTKM